MLFFENTPNATGNSTYLLFPSRDRKHTHILYFGLTSDTWGKQLYLNTNNIIWGKVSPGIEFES